MGKCAKIIREYEIFYPSGELLVWIFDFGHWGRSFFLVLLQLLLFLLLCGLFLPLFELSRLWMSIEQGSIDIVLN